jgi:hypothetical protein
MQETLLFFLQTTGAVISIYLGLMYVYKVWRDKNAEPIPAGPDRYINTILVGLAIAAVLVSFVSIAKHYVNSRNSPVLPENRDVELVDAIHEAFSDSKVEQSHRHDDAMNFAAICIEMAGDIEFDGTLPPDMRRITTGTQLSTFRNDLRFFALNGRSLGEQYPKLKSQVADYLDSTAGKDAGPLSDEQRAVWVRSLQTLGISTLHAAAKI